MTPEYWMTIGQLVVLFVQLVLLAFQAWFLYGTLGATRLSAEAAKKSADVAEKSVNNIERPYVLVESVTPKIREYMAQPGSPAPSVPPYVAISLRNYGRSPALVLEMKAALENVQVNIRSISAPFIPVVPLGKITVIGPHESWEHTCRYSNLIGEGERSQVESGTFIFRLYVSVRITGNSSRSSPGG